MKVILQAFRGQLKGTPIDIPESSGTRWDMVLTKPLTVVHDYGGEVISTRPELGTRCTFEWTGKYDGEFGARIYEMIDISKL